MDSKQPSFFEGVAQFNIAAGVIEPTTQQFDPKLVGFYTGMQCEELAEKLNVIFGEQPNNQWLRNLISGLEELGQSLKEDKYRTYIAHADRVELLDADIDVLVVTEGAILSSGADGTGGRGEVNRSNLAKIVDGKVIRDPATGKILKPEGWTKPNLAPFVCKS